MTDPFEHGFEVAQRRRLDLPLEPINDERRRWQRPGRIGWQVIVAALGVVVLVAIGRSVTARNATGLKANCTKFQLAAGEKSVPSRSATLLHWAATAPAGTRFVVAIDRAGSAATAHAQATPVQTMGSGCLAHGQFGVLVPPGSYRLTLIRAGDAANADEPVASRPVTVTTP